VRCLCKRSGNKQGQVFDCKIFKVTTVLKASTPNHSIWISRNTLSTCSLESPTCSRRSPAGSDSLSPPTRHMSRESLIGTAKQIKRIITNPCVPTCRCQLYACRIQNIFASASLGAHVKISKHQQHHEAFRASMGRSSC